MKKITFFLIVNLLLSSCHKFKDFIPPHPTPQFNKTFGGSADDAAASVVASPDGGYVMAGYTNSNNGDVSGNHGSTDAWIVKLDKHGEMLWQRALGGSSNDAANHITATSDGGYIITGYTDSNDGDVSGNHGARDAWIVKLNREGNIIWQRALGGSAGDGANSITTTTDGGYILTGSTESNDGDVSGQHGGFDAWIVKLDREGNILWQKTLGGSESDGASSVIATIDHGYIIAGSTESNDGDVSGNHGDGSSDVWVVKLDREGNLLWQKTLGGSDTEGASSIIPTIDHNYIIAGTTQSDNGDVSVQHGVGDVWVVKIDGSGNILWEKTLGGADFDVANYMTTAWNGGYIIAGSTYSNDGDVSGNHGQFDAWVVRLDREGNILWQETLGGINFDHGLFISKTQHGNYVMAGRTQGNEEDAEGIHYDAWIVTLKD